MFPKEALKLLDLNVAPTFHDLLVSSCHSQCYIYMNVNVAYC